MKHHVEPPEHELLENVFVATRRLLPPARGRGRDVPDPTRTHKGARGQQNWSEPVMHRQDPGIDGTSKELGKLRSVGGLELGGEDGWGEGERAGCNRHALWGTRTLSGTY